MIMKAERKRRNIAIIITLAVIITFLFTGCFRITRLPDSSGKPDPVAVSNTPAVLTPSETQSLTYGYDREPFTQYIGNGEDTVTIMLYLCGSDLESKYGCATADLNEILYADIGDNVNIVVETGGALEWMNGTISNTTNQRYLINYYGLSLIEDNLGQKDMTSPETLGDFIQYCSYNYPANRNILILWDHGGGTVSGYGYDEIFDYYNYDSMTLDELKYALELGNTKFEIIGFDACLMATVETGFVLKDYADYMIASQKLEPSSGWYYTNWIEAIGSNPSISPVDLARIAIDDYVVNASYESYAAESTLSFIDLLKMDELYVAMLKYFSAANKMITDGNFADVSRARAASAPGTRSKDVQSDADHVDLVALAQNLENSESDDLIRAVQDAIVYFNYANTSNVNGLTVYFPYSNLSYFDQVIDTYEYIGIDEQYISFLSDFISVMLGGQASAYTADYTTPGGNTQIEDWSAYDWYDYDLVEAYEGSYAATAGQYYDLLVTEKGDNYVLSLTDEDWQTIVGIELQVYLDDGYGYIDLGSDNVYEFDEDGDLLITFDNTWVSVNGQTIAFYAEADIVTDDGFWYTYGSSPAYLNGELVDIIIMWDDDNPYGYVVGARYSYDGAISQKGYAPIYDGDVIEFLCDYYNYDYSYDDFYIFNDPITVDGELTISYEDIGYGDCLVYYMLTDIYGNQYWTEQVLFYD